jgi:Tfp pilus assembly protein PilN
MHACTCDQRIRLLETELALVQQQLAAVIEEHKRDKARHQELVAIAEASRDAIWS